MYPRRCWISRQSYCPNRQCCILIFIIFIIVIVIIFFFFFFFTLLRLFPFIFLIVMFTIVIWWVLFNCNLICWQVARIWPRRWGQLTYQNSRRVTKTVLFIIWFFLLATSSSSLSSWRRLPFRNWVALWPPKLNLKLSCDLVEHAFSTGTSSTHGMHFFHMMMLEI